MICGGFGAVEEQMVETNPDWQGRGGGAVQERRAGREQKGR